MLQEMTKITTQEYDFFGTNDAGTIIGVTCPKCKEIVRLCIDGAEWWETKCVCGYTWSCHIVIEGEKDEHNKS
jgi:hypothetical protein